MAQYDGSIRINTQIDSKNASVQIMTLENRIVKTADKIALLRSKMDALKNAQVPTEAFLHLDNEIRKTETDYAKLQAEMEKPGKPTEKYKLLQSELRTAQKELEKLVAQQTEWEQMGIPQSGGAWDILNEKVSEAAIRVDELNEKMYLLETSGKAFDPKVSTEQLEAAKQKIEELKQKMEELKASRGAYISGTETEEYARLSQQLQYAQNDMAVLNQRHKELEERQARNRDGYKRLGKAARDGAKTASKAAKGMSDSLKVGLKNILKYGLGIRSLYALINKIRTGIKEGFSNLYNDKNMTAFKESVDSLKASLLTLKNAFAAAFRPLVEAAIPYLQKAIEYMTRFLDVVGQIFAAIRGQSVYTKAIKQTTAALKDQIKAQNKQLSSLDMLNNLSSSSGGGTDDDGAGTMFEEVPIDTKILDFLQKIKDFLQPVIEYAEKLKGIFLQGFFDGLGDWEYRWESIKESIGTIKGSLIDIWTDPAVLSAADSYNQSVAYMLGSLAGSMVSVGLTIATNLVGGIAKYLKQNKDRIKNFLISMFDIGAEINRLIAEFSQAFAFIFEAFAGEEAQQLTANLIGIFTDAVMGTLEILGKLARDILNIFIQPFVDNKEEFRTALEGFLSVLAEVTGTIKQGIDDTFDKLNEVYDSHFKPFFDSVASGLSDTVGKFLEMWNSYIQPILDRWAGKFDVLWTEHVQPMLNNFLEMLGSVADLLKWFWDNRLKPLIDWIIRVLGPTVGDICDFIFSVVDTAITLIADMINGIVQIVKGVIDILFGIASGDWQRVWDGFAEVIDGVKTTINGIVNSIIGIVEALANGVVDAINTVVRAINTINFTVPDWVPAVGGQSIGFNIPEIPNISIPRLATGAVIPANREFLAVLGDQKRGTNIEAPLSTIEEAVENALNRHGGTGGVKEITIRVPVEVDGNVLFELIRKLDLQRFNSTGEPSFQI